MGRQGARMLICPWGWEGAILREGRGVYQAVLHGKGDGFS